MRSSTNSQSQFAEVAKAELPRSAFDRSHSHKTTFDAGQLIPFVWEEILPGDTMSLRMMNQSRITTLLFPLMDNVYLDTHFFFVPTRLVWENWQKFCGEQENPDDSTDFLIPQINSGVAGHPFYSIYDYMGIPPEKIDVDHSALPLRCCNLIWNKWFRDQNLQDSLEVPKGDGPDDPSLYNIMRRGKRPDYMTSALPWPQKGDAVTIPLGGTAPLVLDAQSISATPLGAGIPSFDVDNQTGIQITSNGASDNVDWSTQPANADDAAWNNPALETALGGATGVTDLSSATAQTINTLRMAFQMQRLLERDARAGTRYPEILKSHFGVTSPDQRVQFPEYLGGGTQRLDVSQVEVNRSSGGEPAGELRAYGVSVGDNHGFQKSFVEHGFMIGFISARADLTYQQGLDRKWSRRTRFDHAWPVFTHLGEQTILNKEIFLQGDGEPDDEGVFGYTPRYNEYRFAQPILSADMRSDSSDPLDAWHLSQHFQNLPVLGSTFIEENPPIDRVVATPVSMHFKMQSVTIIHHVRPLPAHGTPGLIDHF